jgi:hypothetical protein
MKKLAITLGIVVVLLVLFIDVKPSGGQVSAIDSSTPGWKIAIGSVLSLSWITFILTSLFCTFYIDRKKVAEAEYWTPVGYMFPPRKYLKDGGQVLASIRQYTLIASAVLLLVLLAIVP